MCVKVSLLQLLNVNSQRTVLIFKYRICSQFVNMESKQILEAAQQKNLTAVKLFFKSNKNVDSETRTVLEKAVAEIATRKGDLMTLKYILEKSPHILKNRDFQHSTLLKMTITEGFLELVKYLVERCRADILTAHCLTSGDTYVHLAAELGRMDIFRYFIEKRKVDVNLRNDLGQPLIFAAARGARLNIVRYAVEECNADATLVDFLGRNIFSFSAQKGDLRIPNYLLDKRKLQISVNNTLIIHDAIRHTHRLRPAKRANFMKYFVVGKCVNVNNRDKGGRTPLHWALLMNQYESVKFLIEHGATINQPDNLGRTPLHEAAAIKNRGVCNYLIDHGADIQFKNLKGQTPLHVAVSEGRLANVKYFVECGADIHSSDAEGKTSLHRAAESGKLSLVKYLVQHGADPERKDVSGQTPLQLAIHKDVIKYLEEMGHRRPGRSVSSASAHDLGMWLPKTIVIPITSSLLDYSDSINFRKLAETSSSSKIYNFLILVSAYVVSGFRKKPLQPSPQSTIRGRMDPIAFHAIDNGLFEE